MKNLLYRMGRVVLFAGVLQGFCQPLPLIAGPEEFSVESTAVTVEQFHDFVEFAHDAAETEDSSAPLGRRLLDRLNFYRKTVNAIRLNQMGQHTNAEDAANLAFLLPLSHTAETLSGPLYFTYGMLAGVPKTILYPTTAFLGSMAVPGIDWGCIVFIGTYISSKDFRGVISGLRIYTIKIAKGGAPFFGATQFLERLRVSRAVDSHLRQALQMAPAVEFVHGDPGLAHEFTLISDRHEPVATLRLVRLNENDFSLEEIRFDSSVLAKYFRYASYLDLRRHLSRILQPFGWDIRDAVLIAFDDVWNGRMTRLASSLPVAAVEESGDKKSVRWKKQQHAHHHSDCDGTSCHHEVTVSRDASDVSEPFANQVKVLFAPRAVQFKPVRYYRLGRALREIPQEFCEAAIHWRDVACHGLRHIAGGSVWLTSHPQYVVYGPVIVAARASDVAVKGTIKTAKISLQVVQTALGAMANLVQSVDFAYQRAGRHIPGLGSAVHSCAIRLWERLNRGESVPVIDSDIKAKGGE